MAAKAAGLKRYSTGKPCKHGHVAERMTHSGTCVPCLHGAVRAYERRHFGKVDDQRRDYHLRKYYGISSAQYDKILAAQAARCAICGSVDPFDRWGRFHVDHNHATGEVRGLLCSNCNTGIGKLKDDTDLLRAAINYLETGEEKCRLIK